MSKTVPNPYDLSTSVSSADHDSPSSVTNTLATRMKRFATSSLVVMGFAFLGYSGIKLFLEKQWLISFFAVSSALMLIPMVDHTSTLRQRLAASFVMLFAISGLASFVLIYFSMFQFPWFESFFNSKDTGPLGLILFALFGLFVGGFAGWRLINYSWKSKIS